MLGEIFEYDKNRRKEGIVDILEINTDELKKWIADGRITDGYTLAVIAYYDCKR